MTLFRRNPSRRQRRLLRRAARGDARALERVYEHHVDGLYAFVFYRVGRDPALAEDAVQETFAAALARFADYDPGRGSLEAWLRTLSRNVIRDLLRGHRRGDELAARWDEIDGSLAQIFAALDSAPLSDEVIERAETRDLVAMAIANLPGHYREVLERKYVAGDSTTALAADLAITEDAVKSLLARARRAFRDTFTTLSHTLAEAER